MEEPAGTQALRATELRVYGDSILCAQHRPLRIEKIRVFSIMSP